MNPFELIEDYEDEEDTLVSLLLNMASQSGNISDIQTTGLKKLFTISGKRKVRRQLLMMWLPDY